MSKTLTYDKSKVDDFIQKKREELIKLEGTCEAFRGSPEPTVSLTSTITARFCRELLWIWDFLDLLIGSTFEARDLAWRLFGLIDKLPKGDNPSLDMEIKELKEKWEQYEPTLVEIKKAIDRAIETQKKGEKVQKEMVS